MDIVLLVRDAKYGKPGSPVAGSHLVRAYCQSCGEPIRVTGPLNPKTKSGGRCVACDSEQWERQHLQSPFPKNDTSGKLHIRH